MLSMVTRSSARRIANNNCQRLGQNNLLTKRISLFNFFGVAGCPPPRATELELLLPASSISSACCNPNDTGAIIKLLMEMVALSLVVDGPDTPNTCSKCFSDFYRDNRKHMVKTYPIRGPTKVCGKKKRKKWVLVTISTVIFYALGVRQIGTRFATLRDQNSVCLFISRQQKLL